jgi:radical SAM protein (TIGR01212 family)
MEIGLESANDNTLKKVKRNHTVKDFTRAINELTKRSIFTCAHVILGLPGEEIKDMIETANYLSKIGVKGVKIHHFYVVKGAELEKEYNENKINTLSFERYKQVVIKFLEHLDPEIIIDRLVGDCSDAFLIAPKWELGKSQILSEIKNDMLRLGTRQGIHYL